MGNDFDRAALAMALFNAVNELPQLRLMSVRGNSDMADVLDSFFSPSLDRALGDSRVVEMSTVDPTPENSLQRCVSGFLSFHLSPTEKFFGLMDGTFLEENKKNRHDHAKALHVRTESIHRIIQSPDNFQIMAQAVREKVKMGICIKSIDPDKVMTARLGYYGFKDIACATSNGVDVDVLGVREELTDFQARRRFPEVFLDGEGMVWKTRRTHGLFGSDTREYWRFVMPAEVFRQHLDDKFMSIYENEKKRKQVMDSLVPPSKKEEWADIWFDNERVMSLNVSPIKPLMLNCAVPPYKVMEFGRGQGEKALSLLLAIQQGMYTQLKNFEREYDPSLVVTDEMQRLGLNITPDGISYKESGTDAPEWLRPGADVRMAIEYRSYLQGLYDRIMYLDTFELILKSRMTKREVESRDADDFRKMTVFLVADQATDLNPLVLNINRIIHDRVGREDSLAQLKLRAHYTSDLAFSNKNSMFTKLQKQIAVVGGINEVYAKAETEIADVVDLPSYYADGMVEIGESGVLRTMEERDARSQVRISRNKIRDQQQQADALAAAGNAASGGPGGGGGQGEGGPGGV